MDAFDADVLSYAAIPGHELGRRVLALFPSARPADDEPAVAVGSVLLIPEVMTKPIRDGVDAAVAALTTLLSRIHLLPVEDGLADLALALAIEHRLRAADAVHLATAVASGADRFITNNRTDLRRSIPDIEVVYPDDLPDPAR